MDKRTPINHIEAQKELCHHSPSESFSSEEGQIKILLIRHAETTDNIRHSYAGTTDSPLTNHGVLQAEALATFLVSQGYTPTHIAPSTLQRAHQTAAAIQKAAHDASSGRKLQVSVHKELVEKGFGSLEGKSYLNSLTLQKAPTMDFPHRSLLPTSAFSMRSNKEKAETAHSESHNSLSVRANSFLDNYLLPLINSSVQHTKLSQLSHGITLSTLYREILARFRTITVCSQAFEAGYTIDKAPRWNNTGYTVLQLLPNTDYLLPALHDYGEKILSYKIVIQEINATRHLMGLKRTGGGIASARADPTQRNLKEFFKLKTIPNLSQTKLQV